MVIGRILALFVRNRGRDALLKRVVASQSVRDRSARRFRDHVGAIHIEHERERFELFEVARPARARIGVTRQL